MIISRMFKLSVSVIWCLIIIFSLGQTVSHAENKLILSINLINSRDYCEQYSDCVLTEQYSGCCTTACGVEAINIKTKNLEEETRNKSCLNFKCTKYDCKPNFFNKQVLCYQNHCLLTENQRDDAWEKYIEAKKQFANDVFNLVVSKWPHLKPILEIDHNLQFTYIEKRTMEFYYLLRHDPNRIVRDKGLAEFVNFYWTDNDGEVLKVQNPSFAELENRIKELNKNNDSHPLWPELREKFKDLAATQEYRDIADKVAKAILQINLNNL